MGYTKPLEIIVKGVVISLLTYSSLIRREQTSREEVELLKSPFTLALIVPLTLT